MAAAAAFADHRLDAALGELVAQRLGVVAAVGPDLGWPQTAGEQLVDQRQQVPAFVLVAGGQPDSERGAVCVDG